MPVDGVYLDLHGAMVVETFDDGEGELLRRVREAVGPRIPIVASLDLHANVTRAMIERADALVAYRTYPHVDMAETGARAARVLDEMVRSGQRPAGGFHSLDYLTGLPSQCSFIEPCRSLYRELEAIEQKEGVTLSFTPGFPMADFAECGMAVFGYGANATRAVERLHRIVADAEPRFALELHSAPDAVRRARQRGAVGTPVVLADTQDNPGGRQRRHDGTAARADRAADGRRCARPSHRSGERGARPRGGVERHRQFLARRQVRDPGRCAAQRRIHRRAPGRRALHLHRSDVQGLPHDAG